MSTSFSTLGLSAPISEALMKMGYEAPTPIQEKSIPLLLTGTDLLAQAQTGTGKTAAFALPILEQLDMDIRKPQALVIAPTRELAIQVAEAFQTYAKCIPNFHVLPIYGGQEYSKQLRALKRGPQVVVGTPGRIMDHLRRGTLKIDDTRMVVLDEADEMLNMGFIEDVRWILDHIKAKHQTALFSATMPKSIQAIAKDYLTDPKKVIIKAVKSTASNIEQRYCFMPMQKKLDALTRIIEAEDMTAAIIFVRTKTASNDIALKLQARGYAAAALNGDMNQEARKKVIAQMKKGTIDMVVATDVAARGIDINRVSHVINYDIPHDCETYTHRIGRTGRAGREGVAILFATGKEERLLRAIERSSPTPLIQMRLPTAAVIHAKRNQTLVDDICAKAQKKPDLSFAQDLVNQLQQAGLSPDELAVILAHHIQSQQPSLAGSDDFSTKRSSSSKDGARRDRGRSQSCRRDGGAPSRRPRKDAKDRWEKKGSSEGKRSAGKKDSKESWEKKDKKDSKRSTDKKIKKDKKSPKEKKAKLKKIAKQSTRRAGASKTGKSKKES